MEETLNTMLLGKEKAFKKGAFYSEGVDLPVRKPAIRL